MSSNSQKTSGKKHGKKSKKQKANKKNLQKVLLGIGSLIVAFVCMVTIVISVYKNREPAGSQQLLDIGAMDLRYATRFMVLNHETGEYDEWYRIFGEENRIWVDYADMPRVLIDSAVAARDARFWNHSGYRLFAPGDPTITKELIKNITKEDESSGLRFVYECYRASQVENKFLKDQILEAYLNVISFGNNISGIETAANYYFGTTTRNLTAAQSASLLCMAGSPEEYDPFAYPDDNRVQREEILRTMRSAGTLTQEQYTQAMEESGSFVFDSPRISMQGDGRIMNTFINIAIATVMGDLTGIIGMEYEEAKETLYNDGLVVYMNTEESHAYCYVVDRFGEVLLDQRDSCNGQDN